MYSRKIYRFENLSIGDVVKFTYKSNPRLDHDSSSGTIYKSNPRLDHESEHSPQKCQYKDFRPIDSNPEKHNIYYGKVIENVHDKETTHLQIVASEDSDLPKGIPITIDRRSIIQSYPKDLINHLTPRLSLKHIWKNLIFREVKTVNCGEPLYTEYRYISPTGFEQSQRFTTLEEAKRNVSTERHRNIITHYKNYYGFTTDQSLIKSDPYFDKEIFFSKKCYSELDWSEHPTGDFYIGEKEEHTIPPIADSLICGLVEIGEKGLFFRKWFVCSKQFFILWTMVCDSKNDSLTETKQLYNSTRNQKEIVQKLKSFDRLMLDLDTSSYNVAYNMKMSLSEKRHKHYVWNLEKAVLFFSDRYQKVARILFHKNHLDDRSGYSYSDDNDYDKFQKRLRKNLLWPKHISFQN
jgi:hypothetical protein